jgi:hypothetical protein
MVLFHDNIGLHPSVSEPADAGGSAGRVLVGIPCRTESVPRNQLRRMRLALSRSPVVWKSVLALYEGVRKTNTRVDDFTELNGSDEGAREHARVDVTRRLAKFGCLHNDLLELERRIESTPERYVNVRAKLISKIPRLKVECSRELRSIPFHPAQWKQFRALVEGAVEEISGLERELSPL